MIPYINIADNIYMKFIPIPNCKPFLVRSVKRAINGKQKLSSIRAAGCLYTIPISVEILGFQRSSLARAK